MTLDMYNYTQQATHHAKFDFNPTTWVVWANSGSSALYMLISSEEKSFQSCPSPVTIE